MDEFLVVKRGYVYEFNTKTSYPGKCYALAVSADSRGADRLVSVIILSSAYTPEYVQIAHSQFPEGVLYCNCGKVTFTERWRMMREVFQISDKKMAQIDHLIGRALGLNPAALEAENRVYKELYLELLDKALGGRSKIVVPPAWRGSEEDMTAPWVSCDGNVISTPWTSSEEIAGDTDGVKHGQRGTED